MFFGTVRLFYSDIRVVVYTMKLTSEHFISKGGHVFEISPKIRSEHFQRRKIHNLRNVSDSNASQIQILGHNNIYLNHITKCFILSKAAEPLSSMFFIAINFKSDYQTNTFPLTGLNKLQLSSTW